jgi:hypothetical protein
MAKTNYIETNGNEVGVAGLFVPSVLCLNACVRDLFLHFYIQVCFASLAYVQCTKWIPTSLSVAIVHDRLVCSVSDIYYSGRQNNRPRRSVFHFAMLFFALPRCCAAAGTHARLLLIMPSQHSVGYCRAVSSVSKTGESP